MKAPWFWPCISCHISIPVHEGTLVLALYILSHFFFSAQRHPGSGHVYPVTFLFQCMKAPWFWPFTSCHISIPVHEGTLVLALYILSHFYICA
ncbi:hypothetical protein DPMN_011208 [Dreissena polymorpha]|uniref:Uncharacterized protein n=1 Tax=Dreissena polymorpha TaxID=45954 RepID=A0A9D4S294_DREPO|nr:hypothetical protein DPMN_011208 [Dreissena polymorpha]